MMTKNLDLARSMKAWVCKRYGGPKDLEFAEVPIPALGDHDVLVKVQATTVASADSRVRSFNLPRGMRLIGRLVLGWSGPRRPILGTELSGTVVAIGKCVTRFSLGDDVIAFPGGQMGAHAQYFKIAEDGRIAPMPDGLSFVDSAALCFGGTTALHFLRATRTKEGSKVLIIGASGSVGTALVQLAKVGGAHVTGVCSASNADMVRKLGAERVIDYHTTPPTSLAETFDIVFECVGALSFGQARKLLNEDGRFAPIAGNLSELLAALWAPLIGKRRVVAAPVKERASDVADISNLASSGTLKPVVDRVFAFSAMREAHAYVDSGRKRGNVVIDMTQL